MTPGRRRGRAISAAATTDATVFRGVRGEDAAATEDPGRAHPAISLVSADTQPPQRGDFGGPQGMQRVGGIKRPVVPRCGVEPSGDLHAAGRSGAAAPRACEDRPARRSPTGSAQASPPGSRWRGSRSRNARSMRLPGSYTAASRADVFTADGRNHPVMRMDPRAERGHEHPPAPPLVRPDQAEQVAQRADESPLRRTPRLSTRRPDVRGPARRQPGAREAARPEEPGPGRRQAVRRRPGGCRRR